MLVDGLQRRIRDVGSYYFKTQESGEDVFNTILGRLVWNATWRVSQRLLVPPYRHAVDHFQSLAPKQIAFDAPNTYFSIRHGAGHVVDGDWDHPSARVPLDVNPYTQPDYTYARYGNVEVIHGLQERFVEGKEWEETALYDHSMQRLAKGHRLWGFGADTVDDFKTYCGKIDRLYNKINRTGYVSQRDLPNGRLGDEVSVVIGRKGNYFFNNGIHRLAIARALQLDRIPVVVTGRHRSWVQFRNQVANQPETRFLEHPDLTAVLREDRTSHD